MCFKKKNKTEIREGSSDFELERIIQYEILPKSFFEHPHLVLESYWQQPFADRKVFNGNPILVLHKNTDTPNLSKYIIFTYNKDTETPRMFMVENSYEGIKFLQEIIREDDVYYAKCNDIVDDDVEQIRNKIIKILGW